jgi:hypothetical protein
VPGYGPIPAAQVRELAATAKLKPLVMPSATPESGYRPSSALAAFVRAREKLLCRVHDEINTLLTPRLGFITAIVQRFHSRRRCIATPWVVRYFTPYLMEC